MPADAATPAFEPASAVFWKQCRALLARHRMTPNAAKWLARFLAFRKGKAPETLGAADVKSYLDYLATVRDGKGQKDRVTVLP